MMATPARWGWAIAWATLLASCALLADCRNDTAPSGRHPTAPTAPAHSSPAGATVALQQHRVLVEGHPLSVWEKRPPALPVLAGVFVLLHGRTWSSLPDYDLQVPGEHRSLMDALVAQGYGVYAVDLRGYGATPRDQSGWLSPQRAVDDLVGVLRWVSKRHGQPVVLLGWSLGSMVAQLCAQQHGELLRALVLYGYPARPGMKASPEDYPVQPPVVVNDREGALADFITPGSISQRAKDAFVHAALAADPALVMWRYHHQFDALDPAKIEVPTLLIHGEHDPYARLKNQRALIDGIGHDQKQWVVIAGADHAVHLENSQPQFVAALTGFLTRLARGQPLATPATWPQPEAGDGG